MKDVERQVLRKVKPSPAEDRKVFDAIEALVPKVLEAAEGAGAHIEPKLVGSVAKRTHLKDPDIDLFMMFQESTPLQQLKEQGVEIGKRVLGGKEHYAQHPYVRGKFRGFQVDLVPCFRIRDTRKKMSAVDRTPFHTEFVKQSLRSGQHDQVRLLKRFMKGIGCYGAEAKVQGFSGYLCELFIIRFGTFEKTLAAASDWSKGVALDLPGHPGRAFQDPITFVDPVDSGRNVASAVSTESLVRFARAARSYGEKPDIRFFYPKKRRTWTQARISKAADGRLDNFIIVSFELLDLIDDVLYPQLRKSLAAVTSLLRRRDFEVLGSAIVVDDEVNLLLELESMRLPKERIHRGPPAGSPNEHEFLAKWKSAGLSEPYTERGRWFVVVEREYRRGDTLVRERIDSLTLGKDIKKIKEFEIASGRRLLDKRYAAALTDYLDDMMPWER